MILQFLHSHSLKKLCTAEKKATTLKTCSIFFALAYHWSPVRKYTWTPYSLKGSGKAGFGDAQVVSSGKKLAYIALGSNIGDRFQFIEDACNRMASRGITLTRTSSLWETKPMYFLAQESFLNGVCEVETELQPLDLLNQLQDIENELGRKKLIKNGPRNIDLDILLYGDETVNHQRLQIPHPRIIEREFVLRPLSELIPEKPLNVSSPWKLTQDYLNALTLTNSSTVTPLTKHMESVKSMKSDRQTKIMAILNMTPDSFSDGNNRLLGLSTDKLDSIIRDFIDAGASIIDIGGQSSKPYAISISTQEEIDRILPAIEAAQRFRKLNPGAKKFAISVDTYRAEVAEAAVISGADIINDVSAGYMDHKMLYTMAKLGKTICLSHMRGTPHTMNQLTDYSSSLIPTIARELMERIKLAESAGIRRWRIILDPGIGFAKTQNQNLEILRRFDELRDWPGLRGYPWLIGSSRKGFIGKITGVELPHERTWGTSATVAAAVMGGADIVRVHDVKEMAQVARMSDAIWRV